MRMQQRGRIGQSTLEYILVATAIVAAVVIAANTLIRPAINKSMTDSKGMIENSAGKVKSGLGL